MSQELKIWLHNNPFDKKIEAKPHSDAILQQLLQNTLNTSKPVKILTNSNGKPFIKEPVFFSHSNSRNLYAYVVSKTEVSIDIEKIKPQRDVMKLAARFFHPDEYRQMSQLTAENRTQMFYQLWTQKEAWCKLEGGNLWSYLNRSAAAENPTLTQQGSLIHLTNITDIDGFACTIASTTEFNHIWINSIA